MDAAQRIFVGREAEQRQLREVLTEGAQGRGALVFLEGDAGLGKSTLLDVVEARAKRTRELSESRFLKTTCLAFLGVQNPYEPFVDLLQALARQDDQRREIAKLVVTLLKETGSDWLQVIPGVGPAIGAAVKTASVIGQHLLDHDQDQLAQQSTILSAQYISVIARVSEKYLPLVLVIEDAHWIDSASCELLLRLAQRVARLPLVVLVTYAPSFVPEEHPLLKVRSTALANLLARVVTVPGWGQQEVDQYVRTRYGGSVHSRLSAWLWQITKGSPAFVQETLAMLERDSVIRQTSSGYSLAGDLVESVNGWELRSSVVDFVLPESLRAVLEHRINRLEPADREMLALGALQGARFSSSILVELLSRDETDVLSRLATLEEQHRIIRFYTDDAPDEIPELYAFELGAMQRQFYERLREPRRHRYHEKVAMILERALLDRETPSRRLVLGVAYHYDRARKRLPAARYYLVAAESAYRDGAAAETIGLCEQALEHARLLPGDVPEHARLRADVICLLVTAAELRWRGKPGLYGAGSLPLMSLVQEAEVAAEQSGDATLMARTRFLRGEALVATGSLEEAAQAMEEALVMARMAGEASLEFSIMPRLGNVLNQRDFGAGIGLQYEALKLYEEKLTAEQRLSPPVRRHYHRLQGFIGVGEFDRGDFGAAERLVLESIDGMRRFRLHSELPRMLNYLAQICLAMGRFGEAERVLNESFQYFDEEIKSPWRGYNQALLGKVYLEWDRVTDAIEPLRRGWEETQLTWNVDLVQIVRLYYAELLMALPGDRARQDEAERLLQTTLKESRAAALHSASVMAATMLAKAALARGNVTEAVGWSSQALEALEARGTLPYLRNEEVYFTQYRVSHEAGRAVEAGQALVRAHEVLQAKARSILDDGQRARFLSEVIVSRQIIEASRSNAAA